MPRSVVERLRGAGYDVLTVVEAGLQGAPDERIVDVAAHSDLTIVTQHLDFGRIFVERAPEVQIVVFRSRDPRPEGLWRIVEASLKRIDLDSPANRHALIVAGERGYRVRHR